MNLILNQIFNLIQFRLFFKKVDQKDFIISILHII